MQIEEKFQLPTGHESRAEYLEKIAVDVRAGADLAEAVAQIALILAADHREQIYM